MIVKYTAFDMGKAHKKLGYSESYNPFRHKGTPAEYTDWIKGWNS